jgi:hypothetical protein
MSQQDNRGLPDPSTPEGLPVFIEKQLEEMLSQDNTYFAGEILGHEPNRQEKILHYILNGGAANFRQRWQQQNTSQSRSDQSST